MKVLRIIPSMNPTKGGPCQGIRNSIPALEAQGIVNHVVCFDSADEAFLVQDKFTIYALGSQNSYLGAFNSQYKDWLLRNFSNYDFIIIHGLWLYHSYATMSVLSRLRRAASNKIPKVLIMPHGMLDPWFQRDKTRRLKALRNEIYWSIIERKVVNSADGLLFTCEQELLLARETFKGYSPKRELNVGYGIQAPPLFKELMREEFMNKTKLLANRPYILFLSRIHPKKGVDLLIESYLKLSAEHVNLPDLVIAGPKDNEYAEAMELKARASTKIHFPGMLQGEAKWGAFYGCEAFTLPSHQENFGISVAEALACKKPVLITNQVNIFKEIEQAKAGIIESDDLTGMVNMLSSWFNLSSSDKSYMSQNAYQVYRDNFAVEQAATILKHTLESFGN